MPVYPIKTTTILMADGSAMEGPTEGVTAAFRFVGSSKPDTWHSHDFQLHRADNGPTIVGNDFWAKQKAVFDYGSQRITIQTANGREAIPFVCTSTGQGSSVAGVAATV